MSKDVLNKLLNEVIMELKKPANITKDGLGFRELVSDTKVHKVSASVNGVKNQVYAQLEAEGVPPRQINHPKMKDVIDQYVPNFVEAIYNGARKRYDRGANNVQVKGNKSAWSITILEGEYGYSFRAKEKTDLSVFETIKELYSSQKKTLVNNVNKVLKEISTMDEGEYQVVQQTFLQFGHRSGSAVVEQQAQRSRDSFQDAIRKYNERNTDQISEKDLKNIGLKTFFRKTGTLEKDIIEVGIEAGALNMGKKEELVLKKNLIKQLEEAIAKLDRARSFVDREGSDSRTTIERKKTVKRFNDKIKKRKNVKVETKDSKIKLSKAKVSKTIKNKALKGTNRKAELGSLALKKPKKSSANSNVSLAALINAKLPATIRENMGEPALVNRTGRFANSVRVMEVTKTQQGYPSIGYTYQKNPYQVFEDGAGVPPWANGKRDPRQLIDRSIREIAAELLTGRFYTRRI